jgi:putative ABC transport system permease protein
MRRDGGVPARRAVIRWAWRMFRQEWRQQILVLTLLAFTVAGAIFGTSLAYHASRPVAARFGSGDHLLYPNETAPRALAADVAAARRWFGTIDVIGRTYAPVSWFGQSTRAPGPGSAWAI